MDTFIDIETIPGQGAYESFLQDAKDNFKAPGDFTKTQACAELGLTDDDTKRISKDDAIAQWTAKFSKEKAREVAERNWRKTSLDGSKGEVISIAWAVEDGPIRCEYRCLGESEFDLIQSVFDQINRDLGGRPPVFIAHNAKFDLKFLYRRAVILGIDPLFKLPFRGRHGSDYYCTLEAWCGYGEFISFSNLCKALGLEGKPGDIDGSKVWDFVKAGKEKRVGEYCAWDVEQLRKVYNRLNFKQF